MRAFILAAGEGTRLRPLTLDRPKCLVPLKGKPLLQYQIDALRAAGVADIHLVGGYLAGKLGAFELPVTVNPDYASTNMVHSLFSARDFFTQDSLIVYGDTAYEPRVIRALVDSPAPLALTVDKGWRSLWEGRMANPLTDAETLRIDDAGDLREIGRRPESFLQIEAQYMGLIRVGAGMWPELSRRFDALAKQEKISMTEFLQTLIDGGLKIRAVPVEHGWLEVDSLEDLRFYESEKLDPKLFTF
jgi:choline kinase